MQHPQPHENETKTSSTRERDLIYGFGFRPKQVCADTASWLLQCIGAKQQKSSTLFWIPLNSMFKVPINSESTVKNKVKDKAETVMLWGS